MLAVGQALHCLSSLPSAAPRPSMPKKNKTHGQTVSSPTIDLRRGSGREPRKAASVGMEAAAAGERAGRPNVRGWESLKANRVQSHARASSVPLFTEPAECRGCTRRRLQLL